MQTNIKISLTIIVLLLTNVAFSQQTFQLSQRQFDMLEYNPSICGTKLYSEIKLHHRNQWLGFEGAPTTDLGSYDGTLGRNAGLGVLISDDRTSVLSKITASANYAYHIPFYGFNLSLGLGLQVSRFSLNGSKLDIKDQVDNYIPQINIQSEFVPQANAGIFAYNSKFYLGLSANNLFKSNLFEYYQSTVPNNLTFYMVGAYNFKLNNYINLIPNFVFIKSLDEQFSPEFGVRVEFYDKFFIGSSYRINNSVVANLGLFIFKHVAIGYSYDYIFSDISSFSYGSHELILYYQFYYPRNKTKRTYEDKKVDNNLFLKW